LSRRQDNLSWSHHEEVAKEPDELQEKWLDLAELNGWSQRELRAHRKRQSYEEAQDQVAAQAPQAYRAARHLAQGCAHGCGAPFSCPTFDTEGWRDEWRDKPDGGLAVRVETPKTQAHVRPN